VPVRIVGRTFFVLPPVARRCRVSETSLEYTKPSPTAEDTKRPCGPGTLKKQKPRLGKQGFLKEASNRAGGSASVLCLPKSKKGSEHQRRLSGVCSLGGVAVELDRQFPSTDMCVPLGKRFNTEQLNCGRQRKSRQSKEDEGAGWTDPPGAQGVVLPRSKGGAKNLRPAGGSDNRGCIFDRGGVR
jgi:hypothetical protein